MYYTTNYSSPVGMLKLASDGKSLVGLWIEGQKYFCDTITDEMTDKMTDEMADKMADEMMSGKHLAVLENAKDWLERYFAGSRPSVSELPLAPAGGKFRQGVWQILCEIPYGEVVTYGDIAKKMAEKMSRETMSAQAVGGAVGHNPVSIIIPCHRVVGASGSLTGYAGGIGKKIWLLTHEGVEVSRFTVPEKGTAL